MRTKKNIEYKSVYGVEAVIPKGALVVEASNLPKINGMSNYWACAWSGMTEQQKSWNENYGFLLTCNEVEQNENSQGLTRQSKSKL